MDLDRALPELAARHQGILICLHPDGRPHSSNIAYHADGATVAISLTADRVKTRNVAADPRVVLHVPGEDWGRWLAVEGDAELGPVSVTPADDAGRDLLELYERIVRRPHPDRDDFYAAMVRERRQVLRFTVTRAYGQLPGA